MNISINHTNYYPQHFLAKSKNRDEKHINSTINNGNIAETNQTTNISDDLPNRETYYQQALHLTPMDVEKSIIEYLQWIKSSGEY